MATPTEKLKSSGHLTEQNIFQKQKKHFGKGSVLFEDGFSTPTSLQCLRAIQLQQDLELLKERERRAQQRNRQLLQQFEEAQSALDEMLACNTAMKTIRMEYERYLEESAPRWLQQFKEKTAAVQKEQRVEKHFKSRQEKADCPVPNLTADDSFRSQDAQKTVAPQGWSTPECRNNQDGRPYPFTQYSWLTHPQIQSSKFPIRGSYPPQTPAVLSPPTLAHPFLLHPSASSHCPPPQHGYPWLAGTSLGSHGHTEEPHPELRGFQNGENAKRRGGSRSNQLSPELDIKPVRLSIRHSESSGSSRGPTPSTKEKRKKRGRVELSASDVNSEEYEMLLMFRFLKLFFRARRSKCCPLHLFTIIRLSSASVAESQLLEDLSSDKGSFRETQRSEGLVAASPRSEKEERTEKRSERPNEKNQRSEEESGSSTEGSMQAKEGQRSHGEESESCRQEESEKEEKQGSESCERRNTEEEIQTKLGSRGEEKRQKSQKDGSVEEDDSSRKTTTEEEAGTAAEEEDEEAGTAAEEEDEEAGTAAEEEDEEAGTAAEEDLNEEQPNQLKEIDDEKIRDSSSSQDEDEEEMESSEKKDEEESRRDEGKTDSDDSIISPQNKSYKKIQLVLVTPAEDGVLQSSAQTIPETAAEEEEEEENTGSSSENAVESSDGDDVENVLAPQDRKQKGTSHLDMFQVTEDRQKTELQRDSDEFDSFYD